jgi:hypothetical protein
LIMFYNTTNETGTTLAASKAKAKTQKGAIKQFFNQTDGCFTPFEVQKRVLPNAPITSIRRAMTDLTSAGFLDRSNIKRNGIHKKINHTWKRSSSDYGKAI